MKIRWYHRYTAATVVVTLGLNFFPQFVRQDESLVVFGPVDSYRVYTEIPADCRLKGAPAGYDYRGWPLVSNGPYDECRDNINLYGGNTAINTIIAGGVTAAAWLVNSLIRKRSTI